MRQDSKGTSAMIKNSPWVQRNLDKAQFAQARGSQYVGPRMTEMPFMRNMPLHERMAAHKAVLAKAKS